MRKTIESMADTEIEKQNAGARRYKTTSTKNDTDSGQLFFVMQASIQLVLPSASHQSSSCVFVLVVIVT